MGYNNNNGPAALNWLLVLDFDNTQAPTHKQVAQPHETLPYSLMLKRMAESGELPLVHCTGRSFDHIRRDIEHAQPGLPEPIAARARAILANVGTEAYEWDEEAQDYVELDGLIDADAAAFFEKRYDTLVTIIDSTPGLRLQSADHLGRYKISGWKDPKSTASNEELLGALKAHLESHGIDPDEIEITASMQSKFAVDLTPKGANKGNAIRFMARRYNIAPRNVYFGGDSINDAAGMWVDHINRILTGNAQESLVKTAHEAFKQTASPSAIYQARAPYALGVLEALQHYGRIEKIPAIPGDLLPVLSWKGVDSASQKGLKTPKTL